MYAKAHTIRWSSNIVFQIFTASDTSYLRALVLTVNAKSLQYCVSLFKCTLNPFQYYVPLFIFICERLNCAWTIVFLQRTIIVVWVNVQCWERLVTCHVNHVRSYTYNYELFLCVYLSCCKILFLTKSLSRFHMKRAPICIFCLEEIKHFQLHRGSYLCSLHPTFMQTFSPTTFLTHQPPLSLC